nr:flagellar biosynthetic protein FliO [Oceanobacillus salinisoli]
MCKKIFYFISIYSVLFSLLIPSEIYAAPPNVMDCLEEEENCEEADVQEAELELNEGDLLTDDTDNNGSLFFDLIKMFFALLLVLALIYIVLKLLNKKNKISQQVKGLENLGGISLGQNKSIQIVRVGPKIYLIGVGENVELLQEITDNDLKNELINNMNQQSDALTNSILGPFMKNEAKSVNNNKDFKKLFSTELDRLKQNREKMIDKQKEDYHE